VLGSGDQNVLKMVLVDVDAAGHEGGLGGQRQRDRVEGPLDRSVGAARGALAVLRRGRVLPLRQSVDPVVEEQNLEIRVAAHGMDEVVAADGESVPVTGDDPDVQVGARGLQPRGDGRGAAVDAVDAKGPHVVREAARAANPADHDEILLLVPELREDAGHGVEDGVVPASGTPADLLVGAEVLGGERRRRFGRDSSGGHGHTSRSSSILSAISPERNGLPLTLCRPTGSIR